jgi:hypothetical protein
MTEQDNQQRSARELEARVARLETRTRGARWWKRGAIALMAGVVFAPLATKALGPVPHTFSTGDTISASQMNENFAHLQDGITAVEGQVPPTTCASGQVPSWDGSAWTCADDGMLTTSDPNLSISSGDLTLSDPPTFGRVYLDGFGRWNNSNLNGSVGMSFFEAGCDASQRGRIQIWEHEDAGPGVDIVDSLCWCGEWTDRGVDPAVTRYRWFCMMHNPG